MNLGNSVNKNICHQNGSILPPLVLETRMLPRHQQIDPNSRFSDLLYSLNLPNLHSI